MKNHFNKTSLVYDIVVVGSGAAGLYAAISASSFAKVCLITKDNIRTSNTYLAQGGIAASLGKNDRPEKHMLDTLEAGYAHCNIKAVKIMVEDAPMIIGKLSAMGMPFCTFDGSFAMGREAAHSENRIVYADGDATGRVLHDTLYQKLLSKQNVDVWENTFVTNLLINDSRIVGIRTLGGTLFLGSSVILATGGAGQAYFCNTNSKTATGDGIAMAFEAGAIVTDMEFVQFHPTAFKISDNEYMLISEAVRGEGANLLNSKGTRFMSDYHTMAEMAPRDIVSRAIVDQMRIHNDSCVYLDISFKAPSFLKERFPSIFTRLIENGYDLSKDPIPVVPAAHYMIGGIETGIEGETCIEGLYACGEVACTGAHGANRLASNSLLEALVFAERAVNHIEKTAKTYSMKYRSIGYETKNMNIVADSATLQKLHKKLRVTMFENVGICRNENSLGRATQFIEKHDELLNSNPKDRYSCEMKNMLLTSKLIIESAIMRTESRGCHYREDYPEQNKAWQSRRIRLTFSDFCTKNKRGYEL